MGKYIRRAAVIAITWPVLEELDDAALETRAVRACAATPAIEVAAGMGAYPRGLRRRYAGAAVGRIPRTSSQRPRLQPVLRPLYRMAPWDATMRRTLRRGEKLFVDFTGDNVPVVDELTGEVRAAKIFVAVLGASNYTFAQARFSEALPDWIGAHVDALTFLGGVPKALVCDNLKAGVTAASRYEPGVNRTYQDLAAHYGATIVPARPRKPRDKAKVEAAVLIVQRWILARLRNRRFFSLTELNVAIRTLVDELNARLMRKLGASHREFFDIIGRPPLMPLPAEPYQYA